MAQPDSKIRAYLELLRLPNVFTAIADVIMGYWFAQAVTSVGGEDSHLGIVLLLTLTSSCFYLSGMVLNDYFDRNKDLQERPARPIPSRRVPESAALWLGTQLVILGLILAIIVSFVSGFLVPILIALLLATTVVAYDGILKKTWLGPIGMGACRALNVLLGMSVVADTLTSFTTSHYLIVAGIGIYIVGLTWFARTEANTSNRFALSAGMVVMGLGIACLVSFPQFLLPGKTLVSQNIGLWLTFWLLVTLQIAWRCGRAILQPNPFNVQIAVKFCLLTLIVLDAAIIFATQGQEKALILLVLLIPTMFLGRFIYST